LQRGFARLYRVPVAEMVPYDEPHALAQIDLPVTIDLVALRKLEGSDTVLLGRYLRAIEVQRGDYNGRVLTIRRSDTTALASILGCPPTSYPARLDDLGLRTRPLTLCEIDRIELWFVSFSAPCDHRWSRHESGRNP
jgi:hypothetical protein